MKDTKKNKKINNEPKWKKKKDEAEKSKKSRFILDIGETTNEITDSLDDTAPLTNVVEAMKEAEEKEQNIDPVKNLVSNVNANTKPTDFYEEEETNIDLVGISKEEIYGVISKEMKDKIKAKTPVEVKDKDIPIRKANCVIVSGSSDTKEDSEVEEEVIEPIIDEVREESSLDEIIDPSVSEDSLKVEENEEIESLWKTEELRIIENSKEQNTDSKVLEDEEVLELNEVEQLEETEQLEVLDEVEEKLSHTSPLESVQNIVQEIENNPDIESELEKTHDYDVFEPYKKKEEIRLKQAVPSSKNKIEKTPKVKFDLKKSWKKAVHYNYASRIATLLGIILIFFILFVVFLFRAFGYEMGGSSTYSEYTTNNYFVCVDASDDNCLAKDLEYNAADIDHINVRFTYDAKYSSSISFDANYYVAARVRIFDINDKTRLKYTKEDIIVERIPLKIGGEVINFSTDVLVDYAAFKEQVADYITENREMVSAQLEVALFLETDDVARKISYINVPLTDASFNIVSSNLDNQNQLVVFNTVDATIDPFYIFIAIICVLMDLLLFLYLYNFVSMINHLESKYNVRLKRILKTYDKFIVNAHQEYVMPKDARVIDVNEIEELVDARNALNKPIIYNRINNIKSKFYVEDHNIVYCFTIKDDE